MDGVLLETNTSALAQPVQNTRAEDIRETWVFTKNFQRGLLRKHQNEYRELPLSTVFWNRSKAAAGI